MVIDLEALQREFMAELVRKIHHSPADARVRIGLCTTAVIVAASYMRGMLDDYPTFRSEWADEAAKTIRETLMQPMPEQTADQVAMWLEMTGDA